MFARRFEVVRLIQQGGQGSVFHVRDRRTGVDYACKRSPVGVGSGEVRLYRELSRCPNLLPLQDAFEDDVYSYAVFALCSSDLMDAVMAGAQLPRPQRVARDMARTLMSMHANGVVHRDVKLENMGLLRGDPVLFDLGTAQRMDEGGRVSGRVGSPRCVAPEVLQRHRYGPQCDAFGLGVALYLMLRRTFPFQASTKQKTFDLILDHTPEPLGDPGADDLVQGLLRKDPAGRTTLSEVLGHDWVRA